MRLFVAARASWRAQGAAARRRFGRAGVAARAVEALGAATVYAPPAYGRCAVVGNSQRMLLIDPNGHVRGFFPTDAPGLDSLVAAIEGVAAE